jgi:CubicO group peptidase (beta-lactamase class C family)
MTATLIARLVENGEMGWDASMTVRPQEPTRFDKTITVHQLLCHTAGVPIFGLPHWVAMGEYEGNIIEQRATFTYEQVGVIADAHEYSNAGYAMAASMAESVTGQSWETLIVERVFAPLGIECGFGWPAKDDPNQPWGHWPSDFETLTGPIVPHSPADSFRVPPIIAPAGDVSMTMPDMLVFLRENLRGLQGRSDFLTHETFELLHRPVGVILDVPYACGWMILTDAYEGLTLHLHTGSALTFFYEMVLIPERDFAVAVGTNAFSETSGLGADVALVGLMELHLEALKHREAADSGQSRPVRMP